MTRIRAMSYNVRYANQTDHHDSWDDRRDGIAALVRFHRPDVVGFQEPLPEQRADLRDRLPEYELVGYGRRADDEGEGCPIAVRTDRWRIVDHDTFWLSETPETPAVGWDATHPRVATWALITPTEPAPQAVAAATRPLLVCNTHFDHQGELAREQSARLLRDQIPEIRASAAASIDSTDTDAAAGTETETNSDSLDPHVVLLGDFNCTAASTPIRLLTGSDSAQDCNEAVADVDDVFHLTDAAATADLWHGPTTSITDFSELIAGRRIDHVFVSDDIAVEAFATLADRDDRGRYPSDHLPVVATLRL